MSDRISVYERWCRGCVWARWEGNKVFCPLIVGTCARLPSTMIRADPEYVEKMIRFNALERKVKYYDK